MSDQPEPLAAILAEMRLDADILVFPTLTPDKLRTYADRIEAAYKRDREITDIMLAVKDKPLPHPDPNNAPPLFAARGNAAAMRAALNSIADIAKDAFGGPERHREASQGRALSLIIDAARSALAAPARNCDRFATAEEARRAFESAHSHGIVHNLYTAAFDWIFNKAEGGDHA